MTFRDRVKTAYKALKSVPFGESGGTNSPVVIFPDMNSWQDAILRAISPQTQPSDDPHLSSLVAAGYTWLGSTLPEPDLLVKKEFQRKQEGKKRDDNVIEKHAIYDLFKRPNPYTSGSTLWKAFAYSWIINGNVYFLKVRNVFGQVVQLWYEPHFNVQARWVNDRNGDYLTGEFSQSVPVIPRDDSPQSFINYYELDRDGRKFRVERDDVIHFRDGVDPWHRRYGLSKMTTIFREIYGDSAVASYAARLLSGNGVIPYVLGIDDKESALGQDDFENIKKKMLAQTTGQNVGQPLVIGARVSFARTGMTPADLDVRNARYMSQEVFAAVTGLPPQVLNFGAGLERSIYNNMKEADRRAIDQYLQPLWWHIAQELTHQLLPDFDQDATHFMEFDLSEVGALQEDQNEVWKRIGLAYQDGIIKRSEARQALDYEADPGGADDVYFTPKGGSTMTLEGEQAAQEQAMNPPAPQPALPAPRLQIAGKSMEIDPQKARESWERHAPKRLKGVITAKAK